MRRRWDEIKAAAGPGPVHLTFVGISSEGEVHITSASGGLSKEGDVNVPAVPVVKEEDVWRIGGF